MTESAAILQPVARARTWRFDLTLRIDALSDSDDVCDSFKELLNDAQERLALTGLEHSAFFYNAPEDNLAKISGYVHFHAKHVVRIAALSTWLHADRISGEIEWRAVLPGLNRDWRQHQLIQSLIAACEDGSLRREDWVGGNSSVMNRGGRPSKAQTKTAGNCGAADAAGGVGGAGGTAADSAEEF